MNNVENTCDDCGSPAASAVKTCSDCTFKKVASPGVTKAQWITSLSEKPTKKKRKTDKTRTPKVIKEK